MFHFKSVAFRAHSGITIPVWQSAQQQGGSLYVEQQPGSTARNSTQVSQICCFGLI